MSKESATRKRIVEDRTTLQRAKMLQEKREWEKRGIEKEDVIGQGNNGAREIEDRASGIIARNEIRVSAER